jgi:hypothetical protein
MALGPLSWSSFFASPWPGHTPCWDTEAPQKMPPRAALAQAAPPVPPRTGAFTCVSDAHSLPSPRPSRPHPPFRCNCSIARPCRRPPRRGHHPRGGSPGLAPGLVRRRGGEPPHPPPGRLDGLAPVPALPVGRAQLPRQNAPRRRLRRRVTRGGAYTRDTHQPTASCGACRAGGAESWRSQHNKALAFRLSARVCCSIPSDPPAPLSPPFLSLFRSVPSWASRPRPRPTILCLPPPTLPSPSSPLPYPPSRTSSPA